MPEAVWAVRRRDRAGHRAGRARRSGPAAGCSTSARAPAAGSACSMPPSARRPSAPPPDDGPGHHRRRRAGRWCGSRGRRGRLRRGRPTRWTRGTSAAQDVVFGIAASGTDAVRARRARPGRGARRRRPCCSRAPTRRADLLANVDIAILPKVGPEALTGSTRMKAGTATKLVLNTVTTGAMIRMGRAYGNLMVDLVALSDKLQDRGERIVMEVCAVERAVARRRHRRGGGARQDRHRDAAAAGGPCGRRAAARGGRRPGAGRRRRSASRRRGQRRA